MVKTSGMALLILGIFFAGVAGVAGVAGAVVVAGGSQESKPQDQKAAAGGDARPREMILDLGDKVTLKLVEVPPGKFIMGSPVTEKDRQRDEDQHEVTISKPFYMGTTHVTVDQFAAFAKESGYKTDAEKGGWSYGVRLKYLKYELWSLEGISWRKPTFDQKGDHPVVHISWNDAKAFCDWLSKKSGKRVELPTEAQWEYACRAGTTTAYPWGDNPDDGKGWANGADQSLKPKLRTENAFMLFFGWNDGHVFTSPVASFKANAFGLYDMPGNAAQWCEDRAGNFDKGPATDPTGAKTGELRVMRGGSWYASPRYCRSASRGRGNPIDRLAYVGFRVVVIEESADAK